MGGAKLFWCGLRGPKVGAKTFSGSKEGANFLFSRGGGQFFVPSKEVSR